MDFNWDELERNYQAQTRATARKKPTTPQKKKGFLEDQISTGGGIGGALAGGAAGAALGSVVPVLGTAAGGLIGAILGGGLGSAGGEALENVRAGEKWDKNVLQEGLIGGATSLPITGGLKLAGAGLKATTGIGKASAGQLVKEAGATAIPRMAGGLQAKAAAEIGQAAGTKALGQVGSKFTTSGRLTGMGNSALLSQYGTVGKNVARATNPGQTVSDLADFGILKPEDAARVAAGFTGSEGAVSRAVSKAVGNAADVDTSTLRQVFNDALDSYGIVDKDRKALTTIFDAQMKKVSGGARGSLNPKVNPTDALDMMRSIESRIANLKGKGGSYGLPTPERIDQANVLKLVKNELEDQIYNGAGANKNIAGILTPELRNNLVNLMPGNAKWANYVDNTVMKAKDIKELRAAQAPLVNIQKIMDEADVNALTFGGRQGNALAAGGLKDMVGGAVTNLIKDPLARAGGQTLRAAGNVGSRVAGGAAGQSVLGAAVRQAGGRGLVSALTAQPPQQEQQAFSQDLVYGGDPSMDAAGGAGDVAAPTNPFGVSLEDVAAQMRVALQNGDQKGYATLGDLYDRINEYEKASGGAKLNSAQATAASKAATAEQALGRLEQLLGTAGGGGNVQGTVSGLLGALNMNPNARAYNEQLASTARLLGRAMGETGAGSDADAQAFIGLLPSLTDSPQTAKLKIAEIRSRLQDAQRNTLLYGAGATGGQADTGY